MAMDALTTATNAYRNQLKMMQEAKSAPAGEEEAGKSSFAKLVEDAVSSSIDAQYKSEATAMESLTGKVALTDLVTAVANADLTLNTVVAVRDRVISAYQDIIRMPI